MTETRICYNCVCGMCEGEIGRVGEWENVIAQLWGNQRASRYQAGAW